MITALGSITQYAFQVRSRPLKPIKAGDNEVTFQPVPIPPTPFIQGCRLLFYITVQCTVTLIGTVYCALYTNKV